MVDVGDLHIDHLFIYIYILEPLKYGVRNIVNRGWDEKKSS